MGLVVHPRTGFSKTLSQGNKVESDRGHWHALLASMNTNKKYTHTHQDTSIQIEREI